MGNHLSTHRPALNSVSDAPMGAFDPRVWLIDYELAGGGYALSSAGKLIFMTSAVDGLSLALAFQQIVGHPDRLDAVKAAIAEREMA